MSTQNPTIPLGSWVLVTGVTGFVASHVAQEFLERGYRVRGTVRDLEKASWLNTGVLKPHADRGNLELVVVPDLGADNAFDDAVKGVKAIVHIATITTFEPDPTKVIPQTVAGTISILNAALKESSVQQFVFTSSIVAATMPVPGNTTHVDANSWNDAAVEIAWAPPPYDPSRSMVVYMASKVIAEKEVWSFSKEKKPHFAINVVSPASILGQPLHEKHVQSKAAWVRMIWDGELDALARLPATFVVDVMDVAVLHVAAALDPKLKNARIHAWGRDCNWNDILAILRRLRPEREFIPDFPNPQRLSITTDSEQTLALLKEWGHQDGWRALEDTIADNLAFLK